MQLTLDYKIAIEVKKGDKTESKLTVFVREFTKNEKLEFKALEDKFKTMFKKLGKIANKQSIIDKKISLQEDIGQREAALKSIEAKEKLDKEIEAIENELEKIGGDNFAEETAEKRFDMLISGDGKEGLRELAEIKGYAWIMRAIDVEKQALEKKQSGE